MKKELIYLDTYTLQQDMRIRLPKNIEANLEVEKGKTQFGVYLDKSNKSIILKVIDKKED